MEQLPTEVIEFIRQAKDAGIPQDSLQRFLSAGYVPQPRQLLFHAEARKADFNEVSEIGYGGARGGGKTHCTFAQLALDDCQKFEGLNCLFLRKKSGSAEESLDQLTRRLLSRLPHSKKYGMVTFENGSKIRIGHFQYDKDIDNYLSLEYDAILIEQAEQLSQAKLLDIGTVNRTSREDFKPRIYLTWNWGGISHGYLKRTFEAPFLKDAETTTRFIPATVDDNKKVDKGYRSKLEKLTGWKRKAWLDGDSNITAGLFFTNFNAKLHVKQSFPIVPNAEVWCAFDYGFNHPTVCQVFMRYDGIIYVIAEYSERMRLPKSNADGIKAMLKRLGLSHTKLNFFAGHDVFAQRGNEDGKTIADQYKEQGIILTPANVDRINGAGELLDLLGDAEQEIPPKLFIFDVCVRLIEQLQLMQHDPNRPEDVLKVDIDDDGNGGDDSYDCCRYGVASIGKIIKPLPPRRSVSYTYTNG